MKVTVIAILFFLLFTAQSVFAQWIVATPDADTTMTLTSAWKDVQDAIRFAQSLENEISSIENQVTQIQNQYSMLNNMASSMNRFTPSQISSMNNSILGMVNNVNTMMNHNQGLMQSSAALTNKVNTVTNSSYIGDQSALNQYNWQQYYQASAQANHYNMTDAITRQSDIMNDWNNNVYPEIINLSNANHNSDQSMVQISKLTNQILLEMYSAIQQLRQDLAQQATLVATVGIASENQKNAMAVATQQVMKYTPVTINSQGAGTLYMGNGTLQ